MTFVYKECEDKINMIPEQWLQLKIKFLLGYYLGTKILWVGSLPGGEFIPVGGWENFRLVGGLSPVEKTLVPLHKCK